MVTTMRAAIRHHGFALVDVLQQCVTFNKINTFGWYKQRVQKLPDDYDPTDRQAAFAKALEWGDHIPIGVLYVHCLLYTSDAADDLLCVDLGGRRIIKKKKKQKQNKD